jgi:U3 small nucleolar RNA-associated protein 14
MPLASKKASSSRKTKPSASTPVDVNLDEESDDAAASDMDQDRAPASGVGEVEEEEEEEEEGMVDLLDILDGKAKPYFASDSGDEDSGELIKGEPPGNISPQVGPSLQNASDEDSEEGSGSDEDEDEDDDADMLSVSDDDAPVAEEALDDLSNFISGLDASSKRKADAIEQPAVAARPPKRRVIKEVSEGVPENEFAARMPTGLSSLKTSLLHLTSSRIPKA